MSMTPSRPTLQRPISRRVPSSSAAGLTLALAACPGLPGDTTDATTTTVDTTTTDTTGEPTGSTVPTTTDETTGGPVSTAGPEHCGTITADEVWAPDLNPHVITCDVLLEGGTLTIEPGTQILAADDHGLLVSKNGGTAHLDVRGTEAAPVLFAGQSGAAPGQWKGISVHPAAGDVSFAHTTIDAGGGFNSTAGLRIEGVEVRIDHLTVTNAEEWGLDLHREGRLSAEAVGLQIHGVAGWPVRVDPDWVDTLPALDSDYTGNTNDGIHIEAPNDLLTIRRTSEWEDLGVAYHAFDSLSLEGDAQNPAVLTLLDGVVVMFAEKAALEVAADGGRAGLVTKGTAERPVTLTSMSSLDRGAWSGLAIADDADDAALHLAHTVIEWGGGFNSTACLTTEAVELRVEALTLRGCEGAGFVLQNGAFADGSSGLRVTDSERVGEVHVPHVHTMPVDGIDLTGNDLDVVSVVTLGPESLTEAVTWRDLGVPYRVEDPLSLEGTANAPAVLTIEAGTTLAFVGGARLELSRDGGAAGLRAIGTADAPIVFTGADAFDPGAWTGIVIHGNAVDADTVLEHAEVRWGGGFNSEANIRIIDASPTIRDSVIAGSDCWGIQLQSGAAPTLANVTYENNACGDITP